MAQTFTKEALHQLVTNPRRPLVYWYLYPGTSDKPLDRFLPDDGKETEEAESVKDQSLQTLEATLGLLPPGMYRLEGWSKKNGHTRTQRIPFEVGTGASINGPSTHAPEMTDRAYDLLERQINMLQAQLEDVRRTSADKDAELSKLRHQLLEKDVDLRMYKLEQKHADKPDPMMRLAETYAPAINGLFTQITKPQPMSAAGLVGPAHGIAGAADSSDTFSDAEEERVSAAMNLLAQKITAPAATLALEQLANMDQEVLQKVLPKLPSLPALVAFSA